MRREARSRRRVWQGLALLVAALMLSSCGWRGIANVSIPGGPGSGSGSYTVYVQMPDTLALNGNSKVMVADVFVGSVREIELKNWVATLTLGLDKNVQLPKNATAKIGQTSLLGSQHMELAAPADPSPQPLRNGDTIALKNSSAFPTTERTLASIATVLRGGGIPNLEVIQNEVNNILTGRGRRSARSSASWTPSPVGSTSRATTSPTPSTRPTGCWPTSATATTRWIGR